jgi:hypothetical protein
MGVPSYNEAVEPYLSGFRGYRYNRVEEVEPSTLLFYNGMDAILEHRLAIIQRRDLGYED